MDEAVNKVRAEVDQEAELIIGAITDPSLDGKMRVSIVATALDGQQPEAKSVINMVHRIHNRNPGYSDFSSLSNSNTFNFQTQASQATDGATALKIEEEMKTESANLANSEVEKDYSAIASSEIINEQILDEKIEEDNHESTNPLILETEQKDDSNGLENFGIDEIEESTPDLFNSDENLEEKFTSFEDTEKTKDEEDDLEIPAFLRRQKN